MRLGGRIFTHQPGMTFNPPQPTLHSDWGVLAPRWAGILEIYPAHILVFAAARTGQGRRLQVGDVIVQQAFLPP
jgi:hypothetical protein